MLHVINWEAIRTKQARYLIVDLVMLLLATVHLLLLAFDTTYFQLRPYYFKFLPAVVRSYDPIKGAEPQRDTVMYLLEAEHFFARCRTDGQISGSQREAMIMLSDQLVEDDPFAQAHLSGRLEMIKADMRNFTGVSTSSKQAFESFWSQGCDDLDRREAFFEREIKPNLEQNYWRRIGTNGQPVDFFFYVDLGFISIFLLEFLFSWRLAIRQLGREQRVLYPLYHWYDLVSCIPLQQLRFLRLLRILALYYRLIRSDIISLQNSKLYQSVLKYQAIVMEEISDRVAINILTNIQAKTRLGGSRELMEDTLRSNRDEIRNVIVANLKRLELPTLELRQQELVDTVSGLVMESVRATDEYRQLSSLPLVSGVLASLINQERIARMSEQALDAFQAAWARKLDSPEMHSLLCDLVDDALEQVLQLSLDRKMQHLIQEISLKILEELKEISTTSKIWRSKEDELVFERVEEREELRKLIHDPDVAVVEPVQDLDGS